MLLGLVAVEDATALTAAEDAGLGAYVVFESEDEALDTAEVVLAFVAPSDGGGVLAEARADAWVDRADAVVERTDVPGSLTDAVEEGPVVAVGLEDDSPAAARRFPKGVCFLPADAALRKGVNSPGDTGVVAMSSSKTPRLSSSGKGVKPREKSCTLRSSYWVLSLAVQVRFCLFMLRTTAKE